MIPIDAEAGLIVGTVSLPTLVALWRVYSGLRDEFRKELKDELDKKSDKRHEVRAEEVLALKSDKSHEEVCKVLLENIKADLARGRDQFRLMFEKIDSVDRAIRDNGKGNVTSKDIDRLIEALKDKP